jgi:hypothetical protein
MFLVVAENKSIPTNDLIAKFTFWTVNVKPSASKANILDLVEIVHVTVAKDWLNDWMVSWVEVPLETFKTREKYDTSQALCIPGNNAMTTLSDTEVDNKGMDI